MFSFSPCYSQSAEDARAVAASYSKALLESDIDKVVGLTQIELMDELGGPSKTKAWLAERYAALKAKGIFPIGERIEEVRPYHDKHVDLFFVLTTRSFESFPQPVETGYLYLVDTKDKGRTWQVLDLICINKRWLQKVAPSFKDDKLVADILPN